MAGHEQLRVVVASDDRGWVGAMAAMISGQTGSDRVLVASSHDELRELAERVDAGIAMVAMRGTLEVIAETSESVAYLVVGEEDPDEMIKAFEAGARGYVITDAGFGEISEALSSVLDGAAVVPPSLLGGLLRHVVQRNRHQRAAQDRVTQLSEREQQVFELVGGGLDNRQIAERLFISPATVRTHVQSIFNKLDVHSRAEAVALAAAVGIDVSGVLEDKSG